MSVDMGGGDGKTVSPELIDFVKNTISVSGTREHQVSFIFCHELSEKKQYSNIFF
jgi:hypothetical protein